MSKNYQRVSDVKPSMVWRLRSEEKELDWLYGASRWDYNYKDHRGIVKNFIYGFPVGKISIWAGEGGVGKSRLAIHIAKEIIKNNYDKDKVILYFQNEVDIPTFAGWVNDRQKSNFYCSNATSLSEQIEIIKELKPDLVFVDSINKIREFGSGTDASIKTIINAYRDVIKETNDEEKHCGMRSSSHSHIIFLCQLSKDGSAKGSNALIHEPDTTVIITKQNNFFRVAIGNKHRYGKTGDDLYSLWKHIDTGVECISNNRYKDKQWCKDFRYVVPVKPKPVDLAPKPKEKCSTSRYLAVQQRLGYPPPDLIIDPVCDRIFDDIVEPKLTFWEKVKRDTFKWR